MPAGHCVQVKNHYVPPGSDRTLSASGSVHSSDLGFDNPITSGNHVLVMWSSEMAKSNTTNNFYIMLYLSGGGLGSDDSGKRIGNSIFYGWGTTNDVREYISANILDTNPGSVSPTYNAYAVHSSSVNCVYRHMTMTLMEIQV